MSELRGYNPSTYYSTTQEFTLGGIYDDPATGYKYRYCKTADAGTPTNWVDGMIAEAGVNGGSTATAAFTATVDRSGGSSGNRIPLGVVCYGLTSAQVHNSGNGAYVFLMVDGWHGFIRETANSITKGSKFTTHATVDGDAAPQTAYTDQTVGIALAAAAGGTFPAKIKVAY